MIKDILVFGYNEYAKEIAENFIADKFNVHLYVTEEISYKNAINDDLKVEYVEIDDDWQNIAENFDLQNVICFCALDDDAKNVFLTISLRAEYENLHIISLATSKDSAEKLMLAGASKVIPKLETTANVIVESLEKPAVVEVINDILYRNKDLKLAEYRLSKDSALKNMFLEDIELIKEHNIIILAIGDKEFSSEFIFMAQGKHHKLVENDVLVVMGKKKDLIAFEKAIQ